MDKFMTTDFTISEIDLCAEVKNGTLVHRNRKNHGLVFYTDDSCAYSFLNGVTLKPCANTILYLPKGSDYNVIRKKKGVCYAINFQLAEDFDCPPFCVRIKNSNFCLQMFREADKHFKSANSGSAMKCKARLCDIISTLQYEYSLGYVSGEKRDIIANALEKIHESYTDETPKISELSKLCGITPEYFRRIFIKIYGTTPSGYITNLRISRAKELLSSGMYSVSETAHMCGFEAASYFSRIFGKITGIPPSEYASNKKGETINE